MSSLYEITNNLVYLQNLLEDGEIDEQIYKDSVESMLADEKIEGICKIIRNLQHKADSYKAEIDRMRKRRQTIENGINRLKESMLNYMMVSNNSRVQAGLFDVRVGAAESLSIKDGYDVTEEYLVPQAPRINKEAIKEAIKAGQVLDFAELVSNPYIVIR